MKLASCNEFTASARDIVDISKTTNKKLKRAVRIVALQVLFKEIRKQKVVTNATGEPFIYETYLHKN